MTIQCFNNTIFHIIIFQKVFAHKTFDYILNVSAAFEFGFGKSASISISQNMK